MKTHTFSAADFKRFAKCANDLIDRLGVTGWDFDITHEQIGDGTCACACYDNVSKNAGITLSKNVDYEYSICTDVEVLAKHEVLHLLLADFCWTAAQSGKNCSDEVVSKEHEVINRLLGVI